MGDNNHLIPPIKPPFNTRVYKVLHFPGFLLTIFTITMLSYQYTRYLAMVLVFSLFQQVFYFNFVPSLEEGRDPHCENSLVYLSQVYHTTLVVYNLVKNYQIIVSIKDDLLVAIYYLYLEWYCFWILLSLNPYYLYLINSKRLHKIYPVI